MSAVTRGPAAPAPVPPLPGAVRVGLARIRLELREFFGEWEQVVFSFAFPLMLLVLFATIFSGGETGIPGLTVAQTYVPAMISAGLMAVSFQNLGTAIPIERDQGTLRRLMGTPMPRSAYFLGKVGMVVVLGLAQIALLVAAGVLFYDLELPADTVRWLHFGWISVLALASCSLLGIAVSSLARSARTATAVTVLPFTLLQFISGVYIPVATLPDWVVDVSALFPLKWIAQGLRGVFLPEEAATMEVAGAWEFERIALVLGGWCVGGLVLCLLTFRWKTRDDG